MDKMVSLTQRGRARKLMNCDGNAGLLVSNLHYTAVYFIFSSHYFWQFRSIYNSSAVA